MIDPKTSGKYLRPSELAELAARFVEDSMSHLTPFNKQEVVAIANVLVEIEVRRFMRDESRNK